MRAILIDPHARAVTEIDIGDRDEAIQELVKGFFEIAVEFPSGDLLFVNEEGLYEFNDHFDVPGAANTLAGPGVIVGPQETLGTHTAARMALVEATKLVTFTDRNPTAEFMRGFEKLGKR